MKKYTREFVFCFFKLRELQNINCFASQEQVQIQGSGDPVALAEDNYSCT